MAKTEEIRKKIKTNYVLPKDVQDKLDDWNKLNPIKLEFIFDEGSNCWEIYRLKHKAAIPDEDILHWQMAAPTKGTAITTAIFDWLRRYDQSNGGLLDRDELKKKWLKQWAILRMKQKLEKEKRAEDFRYGYGQIIKDLDSTTFAVPITVGFNNKTQKKILAVPKGTAKKMKQQERRVMSG